MKDPGRWLYLVAGVVLGGLGAAGLAPRPAALAGGNDRFEDYILSTGPVAVNPRIPTDGIWLLDYRSGKLLATLVDRTQGKITDWADVDLVTDFGLRPRADVHFLMTTGQIAQGQAALYIAETSSGKMGVYTMAPRFDGQAGIMIRRHDVASFRRDAVKEQPVAPVAVQPRG